MTDAREPPHLADHFPFGLDGVEIHPGDHIGCFYRGERERDTVWLSYLGTGMRDGHSCVCLVDTTDPDHLRARVRGATRDDTAVGPLDLHVATDAYLAEGIFSTEHMLDFLASTLEACHAQSRPVLVRATGEMSWVLRGAPGADAFVEYEHALNAFASEYQPVLLCMYDIEKFPMAMLIESIRAHPMVLVGGLLVANPWYEPWGAGTS